MPRYDFRTPRLYVDPPLAEGTSVALGRSQANYLGNVLRLKTGDGVLVFNGRDGEWRATLASPGKRSPALVIGSRTRPQTGMPRSRGSISSACAPTRSRRPSSAAS